LLRTLTRLLDSDDAFGAKVQQNQEALSDHSYSSIELPEEVGASDSESENEHPISCSSALPEQIAKPEVPNEQHTTELEQPTATLSTSSKKKKKGKVPPKIQASVETPSEHPMEC
jgi:hypothetical protein